MSMVVLGEAGWRAQRAGHELRVDAWLAPHLDRRRRGEKHPVEDFLFEYYSLRPGQLRRWHPGVGVGLASGSAGPAEHAGWRWYRTDPDGVVHLDAVAYLADRSESVRYIHRLLSAIASRPAFTGCFGLHEWAMVYRQGEHRHPLPLRLGQAGTDAVVDGHPIRCSHFDAFRFFTPAATSLNRLQPTRDSQVDLDQPGCLHAAMDCYKWAAKLGPVVPGDLLLDCFALARDVRRLDMRASPYDLAAYGEAPVAIETADGKAEYVTRQRAFAERAAPLRAQLVAACAALLETAVPR
ncbi:MAG: hypothetical protein QOJ50_3117 [Cryptosporangiaceae bacterium]|nr:hypothetical protein [Cryptosporangiaceae bacterium]